MCAPLMIASVHFFPFKLLWLAIAAGLQLIFKLEMKWLQWARSVREQSMKPTISGIILHVILSMTKTLQDSAVQQQCP